MAIEIRVDVLYEDLAAKLLAEVRDVAADDRSQIEQDRRAARGQRGEKFRECLGREDRFVDNSAWSRWRPQVTAPSGNDVEQTH
jgi:hypothetical protein